MLYEPIVQPIEISGFLETRNYTITPSGKAFRNLVDGLYSRKIEAVVRELCSNAYDSHIAAGCPGRQFKIITPHGLLTKFGVRDYGTGMSHELVLTIYSSLFSSTKDKSNKENGMLGLGSKSPFAYTDGFTLRCFDGQTRRTYASYLGEDGVPFISLADESPSEEERGVEVSFPVKSEDREAFDKAMTRVLKAFAVQPLGVSMDMAREIRGETKRHGTDWAIADSNWLPRTHKIWALQGCVLYPVELDECFEDYTEKNSARTLVAGLNCKVVLDFPMGELKFTPGRETLEYVESTKENVIEKFRVFQTEISEQIEVEFDDCPTDWEKAVKAARNDTGDLFSGLFSATDVSKRVFQINSAIQDSMPRDQYYKNSNPGKYPFRLISVDGRQSQYTGRRSSKPLAAWRTGVGEVTFFEMEPDIRAPFRRIQHFLEKNQRKWGFIYDAGAEVEWKKFGYPPIVRVADLTLPSPKARENYTPPKAWTRYVEVPGGQHANRFSEISSWWELEEGDPKLARATYVFVCNERWVRPEKDKPAKEWSILGSRNDILALKLLDVSARGGGLVVVRMKASDKLTKFAKLPLFSRSAEDLVSGLKSGDLRKLVNMVNWERFQSSFYSTALQKLIDSRKSGSLGDNPLRIRHGRPEKNPLTDLNRFRERYRLLKPSELKRIGVIKDGLNEEAIHLAMKRAGIMGLEVLPPISDSGCFPDPLLPLRWENVARLMAGRYATQPSLEFLINDLARLENKK